MSSFDPPETHAKWQRAGVFVSGVALGGVVVFILSFIIFAARLPTAYGVQTPFDAIELPRADGISVFTGTAPERIEIGLRLLQADYGARLLISGLYDHQNFNTLRAMVPAAPADAQDKINCCLDLDYRADNTRQNAHQTALWANIHGIQSIIIVTSAHHVPRAFLEMRRAMPQARLSTYAVAPANVHFDAWWQYRGTFGLIFGEYLRYLWTLIGLPQSG